LQALFLWATLSSKQGCCKIRKKKPSGSAEGGEPSAGARGVPENPLFLLLRASAGGERDLATALFIKNSLLKRRKLREYNRYNLKIPHVYCVREVTLHV
jgi:hypothetical protein